MRTKKDRIIVITGPTASGKSEIAMEFCRKVNGEIICADSMQIYLGMDILTAKPSSADRNEIPHHLFDIIEPNQTFSVADYKKAATKTIRSIIKTNKIPVLCGGTGQYIKSIVEGIDFTEIKTAPEIREEIEREMNEFGIKKLYEELSSIDPLSAQTLHLNDSKRIMRALEIFRTTGKTKSEHNESSKVNGPDFESVCFFINFDRDILYDRINIRVDRMIESGLIDEIRHLYESFPDISKTASQAIGFKELIPYIKGEVSIDTAIDKVKQASRNYAKRQMTWFNKIESLIRIDNTGINTTVEKMLNFL